MSEQTVTQEIESWIAQYGSERDALNVAIAKLKDAYDKVLNKQQDLFKLLDQNAEMLEALESAVSCGLIPITSASEGGAARFSEQVRAADKVRAAIAKAKGENESLVTSEVKSELKRSEA